jgi:hypothetical protein
MMDFNEIGWEVEDTGSEFWLMVALHVSNGECVNSTTGVWPVYLLVNIIGVLCSLNTNLFLCISTQMGYVHCKQQ